MLFGQIQSASGKLNQIGRDMNQILTRRFQTNMSGPGICETCGQLLTWAHDHRGDQSGLDDGPYLPRRAPRKKATPKSPEENADMRAKAWATRRKIGGDQ